MVGSGVYKRGETTTGTDTDTAPAVLHQLHIARLEALLSLGQIFRRFARLDADQPRYVVAHVVFESVFVQVHALRRRRTQHLEFTQPHAWLVRWRVRAEHDLAARQLFRELNNARLITPARLAIHVRRVHRHPEGFE